MSKKINDYDKETVERNFLEANPDVPINEKVITEAVPIPKMITGIFMNNRDPGVTLHFHYKSKTHPLRLYDLIHGEKYTLPVEVVQHLEGSNPNDPWACHSRLYGSQRLADGTTKPFVNGYKSYFQFKELRAA